MIGETVSHYEILEKLGGGGMGVVYKARDVKLDRLVALKFLPRELVSDQSRQERFIVEAKAASALDHPNVGTVFEIDETQDGQLFIAMAYYPGETLKKTLMRGPLNVERALDIACQVARGLSKVHGQGIVHRDIKPANILITEDGLAKIVDFGLAKLADVTRITSTGATMGTPAYMSPEQTLAKPVDHRTDLWSLGVVLYEMLTGEIPFPGGSPTAVIHSILNDAPRPLTGLRDELPAELERIVDKALEKEPKDRYRDAGTMLAELEAVREELDSGITKVRSGQVPSPARPRRALWLVAGVGLIFLLGSLAYWSVERAREAEDFLAEIQPALEANDLDRVFFELRASGLDLDSSRLDRLAEKVAGTLAVATDPPGARASITRVHPVESFAERTPLALGTTPVAARRLVGGEYFIRLENDSAATGLIVDLRPGKEIALERTLPTGNDIGDMVLVEAGRSRVLGTGHQVPAFFIDRNEVTNREFAAFVAAGGYRNPKLWPAELLVNGERQPWESAVGAFVDRTGIAGPRQWSGGTFPEGKADHPVVGVSWYEAAAYARWAGKELPSREQWWRAALGATGEVFPWGDDVRTIEVRANFGLVGTEPVGSYPLGVSPYGCYDMAGNVREWLREEAAGKRRVVGGSWLDPSYMFEPTHVESFAPDYANEAIGFRCVKSISTEGGGS